MEINFGKGKSKGDEEEEQLRNRKERVWRGDNGSRIEMISGEGTREQFKREQEKAREKLLPDLEESIQKILQDYAGGGLIILKTAYDDNLNPKGAHMAQLGVDGPDGLITQVMGLLHGAAHILDMLSKALPEDKFEQLLEDLASENGVKVAKETANKARNNENPFRDIKGDPFQPATSKKKKPGNRPKPKLSKEDGDIDDLQDLMGKMF